MPTNNSVAIVLSAPVDSATLQAATFSIKCGGALEPGSAAYDATNHTIVIHLSSPLPGDSNCTVNVGGSLSSFTFSFQTANAPDLTAPVVSVVSPVSGATAVSPTAKITIRFSKAMDPTILNGSTGKGISGTYSYDPSTFTATLLPNAPLQANSSYSVTVSGTVKDMWGNALGQDYTWAFSTGN